MRIVHGLDGLRSLPGGAVLTIGNYDGVHRGHQRILAECCDLRAPQSAGPIAVVTFEPHPLTVLRPQLAPPRLTTPPLKRRLLQEQGVDELVVLAPEPAVLNLSAEQFWALLRDQVRPAWLVEGEGFTFGKGRGGTIEKLRQWTAQTAIGLRVVDPARVVLMDLSLAPVSSSLVRWLLGGGRVRDAAICLGRPYALEGEVVEGFQRGRTLGIPTANLRCNDQLVPGDGVYAGRCDVDGTRHAAAISIGTLPTFQAATRQIEAHLIGFNGDLYGRTICVEFLDFLRDQRKFDGAEALKRQLAEDIREAQERREMDASRPIAASA